MNIKQHTIDSAPAPAEACEHIEEAQSKLSLVADFYVGMGNPIYIKTCRTPRDTPGRHTNG